MKVTITIPQNIVDVLTERGWDKEEVKVLYRVYLQQSPQEFEEDLFEWVECLDEEEIGDMFREDQELEIGMEVEVLSKQYSGSCNEVGDVGRIVKIDGEAYRVEVKGRGDANWQSKCEIARVNY